MVLRGIGGQSKALNLYYEMEILCSIDISVAEMQEWIDFWNLCPLDSTP